METKILNKDEYLNKPVVTEFINWIASKRLETICNAGSDYSWKAETLNDTLENFTKWRKSILQAGKTQETCLEILKWGGNPVLWKNKKHIEDSNRDLIQFLKQAKAVLNSEKITIEVLKDYHFNSGFTKIYACLDERFLMYDSRVSAAFCKDIACFLMSRNENSVPDELSFTYGSGMGNLNRNPNPKAFKGIRFSNMYHSPHNGLKSNIRFNWIMEKLSTDYANAHLQNDNTPYTSFILQSGYFMLGREIGYE